MGLVEDQGDDCVRRGERRGRIIVRRLKLEHCNTMLMES